LNVRVNLGARSPLPVFPKRHTVGSKPVLTTSHDHSVAFPLYHTDTAAAALQCAEIHLKLTSFDCKYRLIFSSISYLPTSSVEEGELGRTV